MSPLPYITVLRAVLVLWISTIIFQESTGPIVIDRSKNITYQGISANGVDSFFNVPFGQNTGGLGRFAPPEPFVQAHNTVVNATAPGPICPQSLTQSGVNINVNTSVISEDCLNLRIARPAGLKSKAKLPVMAFIYGGGFENGNIYDPLYNPDGLIRSSVENGSPIIYVAMNYRIGVFGFAYSDVLKRRNSLNVGLRDQRLGLEWIQEHIEVFGGDPERVTIFGQSAGAFSVSLQITAFGGSKPAPFHQAIMESGSLTFESANKIRSRKNFKDLTEEAGCTFHDPNSEETLDCLKSLSMEDLTNVEAIVSETDSLLNTQLEAFIPVVDGDFLPEAPSKLFREGRFAHVAMLGGFTQNDGSLFTPQNITTEEDVVTTFDSPGELEPFGFLPAIDAKALVSLYQPLDFQPPGVVPLSQQFWQGAQILRDIVFVCNGIFQASATASHNKYDSTFTTQLLGSKRYHQTGGVFLYLLNQTALTPRLAAFGVPDLGVTHIADIPYVFNEVDNPTLLLNDTPDNRLLASQMSKSWANFATFGTPSIPGKGTLQGWTPAFKHHATKEGDAMIYVIGGPNQGMTPIAGKQAIPAVKSERIAARCGFLTSVMLRAELFE